MKRRYLTPAQKNDVCDRQQNCCAECGVPFNHTADLIEYDHRIALGLTGTNETDNWQALHAHCHRAKTTQDVGRIAKAKRQERKHALTPEAAAERARRKAKTPKIQSRGFRTDYKRKLDGSTERRESE